MKVATCHPKWPTSCWAKKKFQSLFDILRVLHLKYTVSRAPPSIMVHQAWMVPLYECIHGEVNRILTQQLQETEEAPKGKWCSRHIRTDDTQRLLKKAPRLFHHHREIIFQMWTFFCDHFRCSLWWVWQKKSQNIDYINYNYCSLGFQLGVLSYFVYCANNTLLADKSFKWE